MFVRTLFTYGGFMYRPEELFNLSIKPRINDISLSILQEYYNMFLFPFIYTYSITDNYEKKKIQLHFDDIAFCHLLGIESIAKGHVKYNELSNYRGKKGWNNIKSGKINFQHLRDLNNKKFKNIKTKFVYFYLIPNLIEKPLAVKFDGNMVSPPVKIHCEILFYSSYNNSIVHLGIDKNKDDLFYYPRTFFVEKLSSKNIDDIYTINQIHISAKKENRIILI